MSQVVRVNDANFETEVLASELPVLVDFYADWCGPCKTIAPHMEALAKENAGALKVVKVDVDESRRVAGAFQVQSIPTIVLLKDRQMVDRITGAVPKSALEKMIAPHVSAGAAVETWDPERTKLALEAGLAIPVDLRVESDFQRAHLPSAINAPPAQRADLLAQLEDEGARYVFYDRTDDGVIEVAQTAAGSGLSVAVLEGGLLNWEAALLPIERG